MNIIHGHSVMEMMLQSGKSYTKETLKDDIIDKFGPSARFFTCSADNLTAEGIVDFLESRGKFIETNEGFSTTEAHICKH